VENAGYITSSKRHLHTFTFSLPFNILGNRKEKKKEKEKRRAMPRAF
jgi:hypothetical protein